MRIVSWLPGSYHLEDSSQLVRYVVIGSPFYFQPFSAFGRCPTTRSLRRSNDHHGPTTYLCAIGTWVFLASGPHSSTTRRIHWQGSIFWGDRCLRVVWHHKKWDVFFGIWNNLSKFVLCCICCCCGSRQIGCFQWPSPTLYFKCLSVPAPRIEFSGSITGTSNHRTSKRAYIWRILQQRGNQFR